MPPNTRKRKQPSDETDSPNELGTLDKPSHQPNQPEQTTFEIPGDTKPIIAQRILPKGTKTPGLIFTHGAGGGIETPATHDFLRGVAHHCPNVCFQGTMNLKSRLRSFHQVIDHENATKSALGGRSMGARAAVLAAEGHDTTALVLVSYPMVGQNGALRDQILLDSRDSTDVLFISGDADNMCDLQQLDTIRKKMKAKTWLVTVQGADHGMSMKPKAATDPVRLYTGDLAGKWLSNRDPTKTECRVRWDADSNTVIDEGWISDTKNTEQTASSRSDIPSTKASAGISAKKRRKR